MDMKTCKVCRIRQPESEYYSNGAGQLRNDCKSCHTKRRRKDDMHDGNMWRNRVLQDWRVPG